MSVTRAIDFHRLDYGQFVEDVEKLASSVEAGEWSPNFLVGIGRGGLVPGTYLSHRLDLPLLSIDHSSKVDKFSHSLLVHLADCIEQGESYLFVDDINDSGKTIAWFKQVLGRGKPLSDRVRFAFWINNVRSSQTVDYAARSIDRAQDKRWFVFPWGALASRAAQERDAREDPARLGSALDPIN